MPAVLLRGQNTDLVSATHSWILINVNTVMFDEGVGCWCPDSNGALSTRLLSLLQKELFQCYLTFVASSRHTDNQSGWVVVIR